MSVGFSGGSDGKESACNAGDLGSIPWRREWLPTPAFLPEKSLEQRCLTGYRPWAFKEPARYDRATNTRGSIQLKSILHAKELLVLRTNRKTIFRYVEVYKSYRLWILLNNIEILNHSYEGKKEIQKLKKNFFLLVGG